MNAPMKVPMTRARLQAARVEFTLDGKTLSAL